MEPKWMLSSLGDQNSLVWLVKVNGLVVDLRDMPRAVQAAALDRGLIPYIPADRE